MTRRRASTCLAAVAALAILAACGAGQERAAPEPEGAAARAPDAPGATPTPQEGGNTAPPEPGQASARSTVTLWFPSAAGDGLVAEAREIVDTARPADRGTQILIALIEGPKTEAALPAVPPETTLRQLWIRPDGIAYADFSGELASGFTGGSYDELLAAYAIVDSLTSNVPSIRRVGILVDGRERETLGGHVDIRRPLPPDATLRGTPPQVTTP